MQLRKWLSIMLAVVGMAGMLTGCGAESASQSTSQGGKTKEKVLNIYGWTDYFAPSVLDDFEKKYGVKIVYDAYSNNQELLVKMQAGPTKYDLIQPTDYMVSKMSKLGMLAELDKANIPNLSNLQSNFRAPFFDPENQYSVVYTTGITGIAYNKKFVKTKPESWQDLWNPQYKERVILVIDERDVLGMALKKNGFSNSTKDEQQLSIAYADLKTLMPGVMSLDSDMIRQKFIANDAWIGTVWSGDALYIQKSNPDVEFVIPKEGAAIWADTMAIPKGAKNKQLAEQFINYLLEPEVSARNYEAIGYGDPNEKAMALHSEAYRSNPILNMSKEQLERTEWFTDMDEAQPLYNRYWEMLKSWRD